VTMKAADDGDTVTFMFESPSECACAGWLHTCRLQQAKSMATAAALTPSILSLACQSRHLHADACNIQVLSTVLLTNVILCSCQL
jgi:hypothetical protein